MKLLLCLSIGAMFSDVVAAANSKIVLFGMNGNAQVEVVAIPPANGPILPEQGVIMIIYNIYRI